MEGKFSELKEFEKLLKHELGSQCKQDLDKRGI